MAVAAMLLVGITMLLLPQFSRGSSKREPVRKGQSSVGVTSAMQNQLQLPVAASVDGLTDLRQQNTRPQIASGETTSLEAAVKPSCRH